jgi:uncharacterized protein (DUF305 family)
MNRGTYRFAILLVLICSVTLVADTQDSYSHSSNATTAHEWAELMGSMDKMHGAMASLDSSCDGDVDFVNLMLPHHQAAIDMARTQLVYGKDPQIRRLAQEIITDQESEIELMKLWLKQHEASSLKESQAPTRGMDKEH